MLNNYTKFSYIFNKKNYIIKTELLFKIQDKNNVKKPNSLLQKKRGGVSPLNLKTPLKPILLIALSFKKMKSYKLIPKPKNKISNKLLTNYTTKLK